MGEYKDFKTGSIVEIAMDKDFRFPATGAKMLLKTRPPVAKECSTD